jgi:hypothetical protein
MKKLSFLFLFLSIVLNIFPQETKNLGNPYKFNTGLGFGIGMYGGRSNAIDTNSVDTNVIDAACLLYKLHFEYAVYKNISAGLNIELNRFLGTIDSAEVAKSINFGITAKYRFINRDVNAFYAEGLTSFSYFTYQVIRNNHLADIEGRSLSFQAGMGWEHYFNLHLGINIGAYYAMYSYKEIIDVSEAKPIQVNNPPEDLNIRFGGLNLKLGLNYRF